MSTRESVEEPSLSFDEMVGAPLAAMVNAQAHSAKATYDFIMTLTEKDKDNPSQMNLKTVQINYDQVVQGPSLQGGKYQGLQIQKQTLTIPLLSLIPVPSMNISEAEIRFTAQIIHHEEVSDETNPDEKSSSDTTQPEKKFPFVKRIKLHTSYSGTKSDSNDESDLDVVIKVTQGVPIGMEKYLGVVGNSITVK